MDPGVYKLERPIPNTTLGIITVKQELIYQIDDDDESLKNYVMGYWTNYKFIRYIKAFDKRSLLLMKPSRTTSSVNLELVTYCELLSSVHIKNSP
jgi:hypothetical protein